MQNRQIQFKMCYFCTLFQIFVFDCEPGVLTHHIQNEFCLQIQRANKYMGKVDKRRFIKYHGFCARYRNVLGGGFRPPPPPLPGIGLTIALVFSIDDIFKTLILSYIISTKY